MSITAIVRASDCIAFVSSGDGINVRLCIYTKPYELTSSFVKYWNFALSLILLASAAHKSAALFCALNKWVFGIECNGGAELWPELTFFVLSYASESLHAMLVLALYPLPAHRALADDRSARCSEPCINMLRTQHNIRGMHAPRKSNIFKSIQQVHSARLDDCGEFVVFFSRNCRVVREIYSVCDFRFSHRRCRHSAENATQKTDLHTILAYFKEFLLSILASSLSATYSFM